MTWLQVKVNLNLHGVVSIVNVTQIVEEEYEEAVKVSKQSAAGDAPMQASCFPDPGCVALETVMPLCIAHVAVRITSFSAWQLVMQLPSQHLLGNSVHSGLCCR